MHNHNLYVVTTNEDHETEVLGVYDAKYFTLKEILNHYEQEYDNTNTNIFKGNGFIDVLDENGMLSFSIEVYRTNALIANK